MISSSRMSCPFTQTDPEFEEEESVPMNRTHSAPTSIKKAVLKKKMIRIPIQKPFSIPQSHPDLMNLESQFKEKPFVLKESLLVSVQKLEKQDPEDFVTVTLEESREVMDGEWMVL